MVSNKSGTSVLLIAFLIIVVTSFLSAEWAALIILYGTYILFFTDKDTHSDWRLLLVVFLALSARHIASFINAYYFLLIGADMDAIGFHETAIVMAHSIQPGWFAEFGGMDAGSGSYTRFLAVFYRLFGDSKFLGQELSILAFAFSCLLMVKLTKRLGVVRWQIGLIFIYGLLPSVIVFTSITMRESFQLLFFLMVTYFSISLRRTPSLSKMIMMIIAGFGLGILHNGLVIYAVFLVCLGFFWGLRFSLRKWEGRSLIAKLVGAGLLGSVLFTWFVIASDVGGASRALISGEGAEYAGVYRDRTTTSYDRASYGGKLDTSSLTSFIPSAAMVFTMYMLAPFPWQIRDAVDFYAAFEGYLRLLLIYQALATWYRASGERRSQWGFLIICFFSLEFLWAMGTANWGTAIRHHVIAYSLLVLTGGPGLLRMVIRPFASIKRRARRTRYMSPVNRRGLAGGIS